jgi:hypothetical protein
MRTCRQDFVALIHIALLDGLSARRFLINNLVPVSLLLWLHILSL